jgi:hypothetical protein
MSDETEKKPSSQERKRAAFQQTLSLRVSMLKSKKRRVMRKQRD